MVLVLASCEAAPPAQRPGDNPPLGDDRYSNIANCTPRHGDSECPGPTCGDAAVGPPDGEAVDLALCGTLDVVFSAGSLVASVAGPDLVLHLLPGSPVQGQTRVEASPDGVLYTVVGFVGELDGLTHSQVKCLADTEPGRVLIDLANCNLLSNASFFRFSDDQPGGASLMIDAVRALSFRPR